MSIIATALKHLIAAGVSGDDLVRAVAEMEASQPRPVDPVAEKRRAYDRERKRARNSGGIPVETAESVETAPSLDKEIPPRPPKEINPIPRGDTPLARKAGGFGPPSGVELPIWNTFCQQRKKRLTEIAFTRIEKTLAEAGDAGWPPGELVERAIESGHETIWMPKEPRNGLSRKPNSSPGGGLRGSRPDPSLDLLRAAQRAQQADCGSPARDWGDHREAGTALPALWTG